MTRRRLAVVAALVVVLSGCAQQEEDFGARVTLGPEGPQVASTADPGAVALTATYRSDVTCVPQSHQRQTTSGAGDGLPNLELPCMDGSGSANLANLGGPSVVTIWASWCLPCQRELPAFATVWQQSRNQGTGLHILGLNWLDDPESAAANAQELGLTFPSVFDGDGIARGALAINAQPATLFLDSDGAVVHVERAPIDDPAVLRQMIATHLNIEVRG